MASWKCAAARNLTIIERESWDGSGAKSRIFSWAGFDGDNPSSSKARRAFLAYDAAKPNLKGSYKLPFADVVDGGLKAVDAGLRAAASRLPGTHIPDSVKATARSVLDGYFERMDGEDSMGNPLQSVMVSFPISGYLGIDGKEIGEAKRAELRDAHVAGELNGITFDAVVFKDGPNENHYRFRTEDLPVFSASFAGQPFLRNHDTRDIGSRDGTIRASELKGVDFVQNIELTTERGMKSFVEGQIDRFSIGWYFSGITCSICNSDWFGRECGHWPGKVYRDGKDENPQTCELIFEDPRGKETSAVNAPAVDGTKILAQLCEQKESKLAKQEVVMEGKEVKAAAEKAAAEKTAAEKTAAEKIAAEKAVARKVAAAADDSRMNDIAAFMMEQATDAALAGSGLPAAMQAAVRQELDGRKDVTPVLVQDAIERQRTVWAELQQDGVIKGMGRPIDSQASGMLTSLDRMEEALTALIMGERPKHGVRPLSGIREAYHLLSGDYEMRGKFFPENVGLAAVDTTTMAGIVANALNKVVVNQFQQYPMDWMRLCSIRNFSSLQQVRWITLGGVGELPTVPEGSAYVEMTWDDQTETDDWLKKGGYLGITLEAIDRDDVGRIQQAAPAIAQAAYLTLGKAFAAIFTVQTNTGPDMSDGNALFDASNHSNLLTAALTPVSWRAIKIAMMKQTELNSGERLGALTYPYYALVPIDLVDPMVEILATENVSGTADHRVNPDAAGEGREERLRRARDRIIQVDFWTDTNNWAAAADPRKYPSIGLGYRFGPTPEIFSVADESSGLMFSNDVMPIKARFFFAIGPMDWRGLHKNNVA